MGRIEAACWSLDWDIDAGKRRIEPARCRALCVRCGTIRNLPKLINQLTRQQVDMGEQQGSKAAAEAGDILRHFLRVNGHDAADAHLLQDTVSVAHSIHVIYKELRLVASKGPPLSELLALVTPKSRNAGSPRLAPKMEDAPPTKKAKRK